LLAVVQAVLLKAVAVELVGFVLLLVQLVAVDH
jgi:hypothetical protein